MADIEPDKPTAATRAAHFRRILLALLTILVLIYFLLEDLFSLWLRPLFRGLGALAAFIEVGRWLRRLPPYMALAIFAVPFVLLEPVKIFSLFWIGTGHIVVGGGLLVLSYVLSLLIVERLFHVTHEQLLTIGWFRWGYERVMRLRAWAYARVEATALWRWLRPLSLRIAARLQVWYAWLRFHVFGTPGVRR